MKLNWQEEEMWSFIQGTTRSGAFFRNQNSHDHASRFRRMIEAEPPPSGCSIQDVFENEMAHYDSWSAFGRLYPSTPFLAYTA